MAKKAKWLEEATVGELVLIVKAAIIDGDEKAEKKVTKAIEELMERTAEADEDGTVSVEDAIATLTVQFTEGMAAITAAYEAEVESIATGDEEADEEDEDEDDEDDDDADDEVDYTDMSQKELKKMCKDRGIKVTKGMKKSDFVKALEADDAE